MFPLRSKYVGKRIVLGQRPTTRVTLANPRPPIINRRKPR